MDAKFTPKSLAELRTVSEAVTQALNDESLPTRKDKIGFICLWECAKLGLLPFEQETCFGAGVELLLLELEKTERSRLTELQSSLLQSREVHLRELAAEQEFRAKLRTELDKLSDALQKQRGIAEQLAARIDRLVKFRTEVFDCFRDLRNAWGDE